MEVLSGLSDICDTWYLCTSYTIYNSLRGNYSLYEPHNYMHK